MTARGEPPRTGEAGASIPSSRRQNKICSRSHAKGKRIVNITQPEGSVPAFAMTGTPQVSVVPFPKNKCRSD